MSTTVNNNEASSSRSNQQQLNNHTTPPSSPNITTPITSAAITNTIKKSLGKIKTDDTDHQLLHGSFSSGCKVCTTNQGILYGIEEEKENLMFKFIGSSPNKPAGSTFANTSSREDVQVMCIKRYGIIVSKDIGSTIYQLARSNNTETETVLDDLIETGKFDEELSRLVSCVTDGINGIISTWNEIRVRLFMKLYNKKIQHELATSANAVYNNSIGWNEFKLAVQQEISIGEQYNLQKLKKMLVISFNVQGNFPNDAVLLGWYFETLPIQVKDSDAASTIVTSGTNLIGGIGRSYQQAIVDSYVPVKEVRINQIQNYRFNNSNSQGRAGGSNNQDESDGQYLSNGFNNGSRFNNGQRFDNNSRFSGNPRF
ncbi:hypothetical protein ACTFIT_009742 [Dictyostelium discoideum]